MLSHGLEGAYSEVQELYYLIIALLRELRAESAARTILSPVFNRASERMTCACKHTLSISA